MIRVAALLSVLVLATACSTGQQGVKNKGGTITANLAATPQEVTASAQKALEDLDLTIESSSASALDGQVIARTAQGDPIKVTCRSQGEGVTYTAIRVGSLGDTATSLTILEKIRAGLKNGDVVGE